MSDERTECKIIAIRESVVDVRCAVAGPVSPSLLGRMLNAFGDPHIVERGLDIE
jgi:flagellar biosynthesis/type III secretory pathway ATPase